MVEGISSAVSMPQILCQRKLRRVLRQVQSLASLTASWANAMFAVQIGGTLEANAALAQPAVSQNLLPA
jgi:hypothetical protein